MIKASELSLHDVTPLNTGDYCAIDWFECRMPGATEYIDEQI